MNSEPFHNHRKSTRLKGYDYAQSGLYFVTICTQDRACLLGEMVKDEMVLNDYGQVVMDVWEEIPRHFTSVDVDSFVIMPNHLHGIICIHDESAGATQPTANVQGAMPSKTNAVGATHASPLPNQYTLGVIIGSFKSAATRRINIMRGTPGAPVWQRNYYERIIRDDHALYQIRQYIDDNPKRWNKDSENPARAVVQGDHV